jgi:ribA/ribD-fused uncharacterized protein
MYFKDEYEFLSNFYPCNIRGYPSVEHYFQASKTRDPKEREAIKYANTPGRAKRLGRKATLRDNWLLVRELVMLTALRIKFADPELRAKLEAVIEPLVEHNRWHDNFWGICTCNKCYGIIEGQNKLGWLLYMVRDENPQIGKEYQNEPYQIY